MIRQEVQLTHASAPYPSLFANPSSAPFHSALRRATVLCLVQQTWISGNWSERRHECEVLIAMMRKMKAVVVSLGA
jgi:hypothetical protein